MSSPVYIRVPDDCGTLSIGLNQSLYFVFTQNIDFQCNHANYFTPPLPIGIHGAGTVWGPAKPDPQFAGLSVTYTHPGTADNCPPPDGGQAGARSLVAGHVIVIGQGPHILVHIIAVAEKTDSTLRDAWPATKIFVNFLLSQNSSAVPDSAKTFLGELRTAGQEAFDITRESSE
jgi:hypothetical protein